MTEKLILETLESMSERLLKIEQIIAVIAVQDEKILNLQSQVSQLWKKHDAACGPDGVINQVKNFQASCSRETIKDTMANQSLMIRAQWAVICLLTTVTIGTLFKALGVI